MLFSVILINAALIWNTRGDGSVVNSSAGGGSCSSSSLHEAVVNDDIGSLREAVRSGVDLYSKDCSGLTGMELALLLENERAIHVLLEGSFDLDAADEEGSTLLCTAARRGNKFLLQKLRDYGSTVDVVNANGSTPLFEALVSGREDVTEVLLKAGAKLNFKLPGGNSYLHRAVELADFRIASNLLKFEVPLDPVNYEDDTPLSKAVLMDNIPFFNLLVSRGADVKRRNKLGETYLHLATKGNGIKVLSALVKHGINVDAENNEGETALFYAAKQNNTEVVRALIQLGTDLNRLNIDGKSYLDMTRRNKTLMAQFLELGVDPDVKDSQGRTIIRGAVEDDDTETMNLLYKHGSDLNQTFTIYLTNGGRIENATLLHLAAGRYSPKAIEWLVSHGAVINKKAGSYTPLDTAIRGQKTESAEKLLELGACEDYEASGCQQSYQMAEYYIRGSLTSLILAKRQKPQS